MDPNFIIALPLYFLMALCWLGPLSMFVVGLSTYWRTYSSAALLMALAPLCFFAVYNLWGYGYQYVRTIELEKLERKAITGERFSGMVSFGPISDVETFVLLAKHGISKVTVIMGADDFDALEQVGVVQTVEPSAYCRNAAKRWAQETDDLFYPPAVPRVRVISAEEAKRMFTPKHFTCAPRSTPVKLRLQQDASTLYLYQGAATRYGGKYGVTTRQYELYVWRNRKKFLVDYRDDARPHYILPFCVPLMEGICDVNKQKAYPKSALLQLLDNLLVTREQHVPVFAD